MLESVVAGLVVAGIGGLFYLSYQHSETYKKIEPFLLGALVLIYISLMVWFFAVQRVFVALLPYIDREKMDEAGAMVDTLHVDPNISLLTGLAFIALYVLLKLVGQLKTEKEKKE